MSPGDESSRQSQARPQTCPTVMDLLCAGCWKTNPAVVNWAFWLCPLYPVGPSTITTLDVFLFSRALGAVSTIQPVQSHFLPSVLIYCACGPRAANPEASQGFVAGEGRRTALPPTSLAPPSPLARHLCLTQNPQIQDKSWLMTVLSSPALPF